MRSRPCFTEKGNRGTVGRGTSEPKLDEFVQYKLIGLLFIEFTSWLDFVWEVI